MSVARILIIAGSDSGGGAGIQADIKTVTLLGGHAMTAVTAVTVQDTRAVHAVHPIPPKIIAAQIATVVEDIGVDVIKIGMLPDAGVIDAVADALPAQAPLILDPVMVATSGSRLADAGATARLIERLLPRASLITPNLPEAEALTGLSVNTVADMVPAGAALLGRGAAAVLIKGGHLDGETLTDMLVTHRGAHEWRSSRIDTRATHGTGCTLASSIATHLGNGHALEDAIDRAREFVRQAILNAPGFGAGHGPMGLFSRPSSTGARQD